MGRAGGARVRRRCSPLLAAPLILGGAAFVAALSGQDAPVRSDAASATSAVAEPSPSTVSPFAVSPFAVSPSAVSAAADHLLREAKSAPSGAGSAAVPTPIGPAPAGHGAAVSPDLLPDLRPFASAAPGSQNPVVAAANPDVPGKPFFTPDLLGPVFDQVVGPFRETLTDPDHSADPTPNYTDAEKQQLIAEGKDLFFSTTAFGQRPSQGAMVLGESLSCATCHSGKGFSDNRTHFVGPVRERELGQRQTPSLFGVAHTAPFGWDGRNPTLQSQSRGAIVSPLEMFSSREPTKRELDALAAFQESIVTPAAIPGVEFDPARAKRGEVLFRTPRTVVDGTGEFDPGEKVACSTCHTGPFFTDGKAHRGALPTVFVGDFGFDPGRVDENGNITGFDTPSLLGARFTSPYFHDGIAGDPTAPSNLLGGGLGVGAADGDIGASGAAAARRALLNNVLPFYNNVRFNFGFTQEELADIAEFVLSL